MAHLRIAPLLFLVWTAASGQSVRSTHSGLVYFFDGYVFVGAEKVQQKFGHFPEIGEGNVLHTELGRAEVLLTPGVFLRVDENSAIRMISSSLSNTRVELLRGSAIFEASHEAANTPDVLIYKNWEVRVPKDSVARIDADPPQLRVLSGTAQVSTDDNSVTVQRGEVLPFAAVLAATQGTPAEDEFNIWAMNRSSIVSEDNTIAAGITDNPDQFDSSGAALGNFSYFPPTGIPSLGIAYPYGLSFWSPYQSTWLNPYGSMYPYGVGLAYPLYMRYPTPSALYPRAPGTLSFGSGLISRPLVGPYLPRPSVPVTRPAIAAPHVAAPHAIHR